MTLSQKPGIPLRYHRRPRLFLNSLIQSWSRPRPEKSEQTRHHGHHRLHHQIAGLDVMQTLLGMPARTTDELEAKGRPVSYEDATDLEVQVPTRRPPRIGSHGLFHLPSGEVST